MHSARRVTTESPPPLPYRTSMDSMNANPNESYLRIVTTSEASSHDYEDIEMGTAANRAVNGNTSINGPVGSHSPSDNSSVPPASGNGTTGSNGSAASSNAKPKRKRSMIACKNCNERRVRCDGATSGLPCSNCKHSGKNDCQFIESKRVRGARGRFESRDGLPGSSTSPTNSANKRQLTPSSAGVGGPPRRARRHSINGTDGEEWRRLLQNSASVNRSTTGPVTYLGESWHLSWVITENSEQKPLHMPTLMMEEDGDVHNRVNKELWEKGAYVLPRYEVRDLLIAQYFEVVHPTYPILCKQTFLHSLQTNTFSHQLVQAVLMVSATHCDWSILQRAGYISRREAIEGFYRRARLLWDGDVESDKISNIQTMFLMQFWWRAVTDHKDPLWWLSGAIRMGQSMGLHRSTLRSRLNDHDKRIWRRLWWLLFLRDRQAASHFGKPMMINEQDCDVEELEFEDVDCEIDRVQTLCLLEQVKLAKLVGSIVLCEFSPGAARNIQERSQMRDACHHRLSEWQQNLPKELVYQSNSKNLYAMCLQITFLAQLLLLNRPVIYTDHTLLETIRKPSETIAGNAADAITKITDDLVKMWGPRYMSQHSMSCMFAAMTVQMLKRRSSNPKTSSDADRKLQTNMAKLLEMDKILPMAGWIHRRYSRILEGEGDEARTISISPPAVETSFSATHSMLPSQRTPTLAPQMRTIAEEGTKQEAEDSWSNETVLHLEHTLTAPSTHHEHHLSANNNGIGNSSGGSNGVQQERQGYAEMMQESQVGTSPIHPEIFDYHWFMENIGDIGNPFFWNPPQEQVQ